MNCRSSRSKSKAYVLNKITLQPYGRKLCVRSAPHEEVNSIRIAFGGQDFSRDLRNATRLYRLESAENVSEKN